MTTVFTIGYEGASLVDFLASLQAAGIKHVLDVRELPQSRRPGFSKKVLSEALASVDINYTHTKQLGDPKHGREAARRGDMATFRAIFEAHLDLPTSQEALENAATLVEKQPTVLLCYERDPKCCHRSLVVQRIERLRSIKVRHLGVRGNAAVNGGTGISAASRHA
jgi:uncharacterized protein (DUF488 family)